MDALKVINLRLRLKQVFLPGKPIDKSALFAGRQDQVTVVYDAVLQPGRHAILFGERGVGKTSLALVLSEVLAEMGIRVVNAGTVNCDGTDDFSSLWQKVFRDLAEIVDPNEDAALREVVEHYATQPLAPDDVRYVLGQFKDFVIIIFDELDRLINDQAKVLLADTIKTLSDHGVNSTVILVGVADTVEELISEHRSIERNLIQVRMPRMTRKELEKIIDSGLESVVMTIDESAKNMIVGLSQGLPYYTHYFGLYSAYNAINSERMNIEIVDVIDSSAAIIENAFNIRTAHHKATASTHESLYEEVLLACALAKRDDLGYFTASDVGEPLSMILGRPCEISNYMKHLKEFCTPRRGMILTRVGDSRTYFYRFTDPLMQPFVVLNGIAKEKVSLEAVVKAQTTISEGLVF